MLNEKPSHVGSWLVNASKYLAAQQEIELTIVFPKRGIADFKKIIGSSIAYYAFKPIKNNDKNLKYNNRIFDEILDEVKPDLIHIFGTEFAHSLSMMNCSVKNRIKTVLSIQGLVSIIAKHMIADLPWRAVYGYTFRNILMKDNVMGLKKQYLKRGRNEIEAIKKAEHIIGRTSWDKACTLQINPNAKYHFCYETLREEFYENKWDLSKCVRYSIFLSQVDYPVKGLHYVLEAMPLILKRFPEAKVYIAGKDILNTKKLRDRLAMTYYAVYIKKLIKKYRLEDKIIFTGPLDEKQMCERFLSSNIFISPSTIENSPNSVGEAKLLGVPVVASYVGGVPDLIKHKEDGFLYQHNAPYMLAHYVCELFDSEDLMISFSEKASENAMKMHDRVKNTNTLIGIYKNILSN